MSKIEETANDFADAVRDAFVAVYGAPSVGDKLKSIIPTWSEKGVKLGWHDPDPGVVLVLTEYAWIAEPYNSERDHELWNRVMFELWNKGWHDTGWGSINPAVQMVYWRPPQAWQQILNKRNNLTLGISLPGQPLFGSPQHVMTRGAQAAFQRTGDDPTAYLDRHFRGDFGDLDKDDWQMNVESIPTKDRVLSSYKLSDGTKIWIITDPGHEVTTILLPSEY